LRGIGAFDAGGQAHVAVGFRANIVSTQQNDCAGPRLMLKSRRTLLL